MWRRIKCIIIKEFIQTLRDPKMWMVLFVTPLFQLLLFGFAATMDVDRVLTAVYDLDNSYDSRELIRRFEYSKYFNIIKKIAYDGQEQNFLNYGTVSTVIRIDHGFSKSIKRGGSATYQVLIDGTDSNTASIVLGYINTINQEFSSDLENKYGRYHFSCDPKIKQVDLCKRVWFNTNLRSKYFFVPGVVALIVMITSLLLTAMAVVREKEIGTIEQLVVSPIRSIELILGKLITFGIIGVVDVLIVTTAGVLIFHVPIRGNLFFLSLCSCLFLLNTLGLGLLISTFSKTQQEALMTMFFISQPMVLLSGFAFNVMNMPKIFQHVTMINPLRHFLDIVRGIFLKGTGMSSLWPQMVILTITGISMIVLSSVMFRKRL